MCYFVEDIGLLVPRRPAGTLTVHTKELHGVSKLLSGVRYVLFVVDVNNGLGGETANIVTLSPEQMNHILPPPSEESKTKNKADEAPPTRKRGWFSILTHVC